MVAHLHAQGRAHPAARSTSQPGDLVLDIGSNDSTTLRPTRRIGLTRRHRPDRREVPRATTRTHVRLIPDFFSAAGVRETLRRRARRKVITSISMFYDLEDAAGLHARSPRRPGRRRRLGLRAELLPRCCRRNAYDTICHEHLEYYALQQIKWMADRVGFKILDVEFNDVNGGSFSVTVAQGRRRDARDAAR